MEYKAKIIQIIPEENYKKFGFIKYPNHDYLNLMPLELWNEQQRKINKIIQKILSFAFFGGLGILLIYGVLFFIKNYVNDYFMLVSSALIFSSLVFAGIVDSFRKKKVFNKYWYFDAPFPIQKSHNLKVGDIINISINFNKEKSWKNK